jgi:hypothetical protein
MAAAWFQTGSGNMGFVVGKVALGQVFSEYFGFPCQSFHQLLHAHHHPLSGASTTARIAAYMPCGLSDTLLQLEATLQPGSTRSASCPHPSPLMMSCGARGESHVARAVTFSNLAFCLQRVRVYGCHLDG